MKILLLNDDFPPRGRGGGASVVRSLAEGYAKAGHDVHVITTHQDGPATETRGENGYRVISLPIMYRPRFRWYLSLRNPVASRLLEQTLKGIGRVDIAHVHNVHSYLTWHSLRILRPVARTIILTFHDVMSVSFARVATRRYLASGPKTFDYRLTLADHLEQAGMLYNPLRNWAIRNTVRLADKRICVSQALRDLLAANGISTDGAIHNGIAPESVQPKKENTDRLMRHWNLAGLTPVFFGGRLSADKGLAQLLDACQPLLVRHPELRILIVGDQVKAQRLLGSYPQLAPIADRLILTGWLGREDLMAALASCAICAVPSVCFDSFPTVNLEAMALGKPVIATHFGGSREVVEDSVTGYILNPFDTRGFTNHLETLLNNPAVGAGMGKKGRERITADFTVEKQVKAYLALAARQ